ncbi:MAG: N-acetylneuraminate synthase family protein [Proteobacteria bacterium]|nr:N-acetylneuraminate synthase family protein [Pseudomonadota bacterium]
MKLFGKDTESDLIVVAEIGVNHEGDVEVASKLLRLAAEAGADAVKFQSYNPHRFVASNDPDRLKRVTQFGLDEAAHRRLAGEARDIGVGFFSAAISEDMIPLLAELCPVIKIASGDVNFEPVIRAGARTGKPMIVSTGNATVDEIDRTVGWVRDEVGDDKLPERLALLHCVSAYPTPIEEANVKSVPFLAERYGLATGYSNHVLGGMACLAAVALGASIIEVHFTDNKSGRSFRDHELSFEPDELTALIEALGGVRASLGNFAKAPGKSELPVRDAIRKGLVAARNLDAGTELRGEDLMFARPASEFAADQIDNVIGRRILGAVRSGEIIARDNVA